MKTKVSLKYFVNDCSLFKSSGRDFSLSISILVTSAFKQAKFDFVPKLDISAPVVPVIQLIYFSTITCKWFRKSLTHFHTVSFIFTHLLKELS